MKIIRDASSPSNSYIPYKPKCVYENEWSRATRHQKFWFTWILSEIFEVLLNFCKKFLRFCWILRKYCEVLLKDLPKIPFWNLGLGIAKDSVIIENDSGLIRVWKKDLVTALVSNPKKRISTVSDVLAGFLSLLAGFRTTRTSKIRFGLFI